MLTNFEVLDKRVDQFSDLVDSNMETLRRATQDNREVFVSVMNKNNDMHEQRYNGLVEDLTQIAKQMDVVQDIAEGSSNKIKSD